VSDHGVHHAGADYTETQHVVREVVDSKADVRGQSLQLGRPAADQLGGGTYAIDLNSNRVSRLDLVLELRRLQPDQAIISAPSRAPTHIMASNSSTAPRAASTR